MDLKVVENLEKSIPIKAVILQLLSFVIEAALVRCLKEKEYEWGIFKTEVKVHSPVSISEYAERKLWKPLGAATTLCGTWTGKTGMRKHIVVSIRRPGFGAARTFDSE